MHRVILSTGIAHSPLMPDCLYTKKLYVRLAQYSSGTVLLAAAYQYLLRTQDQWPIQDTVRLPADKGHCFTEML